MHRTNKANECSENNIYPFNLNIIKYVLFKIYYFIFILKNYTKNRDKNNYFLPKKKKKKKEKMCLMYHTIISLHFIHIE